MMQARRRLLTVLVALTAAAGACGGIKVAPYWVCVPPATVLCVYVLLLREASRADGERARRYAAVQSREARLREVARRRAQEEALAEAAQPSAEIIDISARVADQLYDQYADATVRAVGD
jgi:ABC-type transport system involved in cytochrome bd biosynthesis fused ATPase/permease subunit